MENIDGVLKKKSLLIMEELKKAPLVLAATHENPDGDAVSSLCAMIEILEQLDIKYSAYCYSPVPENFEYLPHSEKIVDKIDAEILSKAGLVILTDCATVARAKLGFAIKSLLKIISFDHHPETEVLPGIDFRDNRAASSTELLYYFAKENKIEINKDLAICILTGLLTDTGNFLYPSTSKVTLDIASEMMLAGAKMSTVIENAWHNKSLEAMKIWGDALSNLEINKKYNIAYSVITQSEIDFLRVPESELDGIAGFLGNLHGVKAVMFLRDDGSGIIKGSLRTSQPGADISRLAAAFGGGGHPKASGFKLPGYIRKVNNNWKII